MKQTKNKYFRLLFFAAMIFSLQSCLKNNKYYVDFSKGKPAVELPLAAKYTNKPFALALDVSSTPTTYYAVVNVASVNKPTSEVTATLALDQSFLDQYNADQDAAAKKAQEDYLDADTANTVDDDDYPANWDPYVLLPDSTYQIPSLNATIPAGQREDSLPILINTSKIVGGHKYVIPLTIATASINISNWNHLLINVTTKNLYDGKYTNTYDGDLGSATNTETLSTVSPTISHTNLIGVYSNDVYIVVDPATNNATVLDAIDGSNSTTTDPSSHWDPSTKTLYLKYVLYGKYHITQTLVKQ